MKRTIQTNGREIFQKERVDTGHRRIGNGALRVPATGFKRTARETQRTDKETRENRQRYSRESAMELTEALRKLNADG
jgi:hypothetical protein